MHRGTLVLILRLLPCTIKTSNPSNMHEQIMHNCADACDSTGHVILSACAWNILRIVAEQAKSKTKSLFLDHIIIFIPEPTLCRYPTFKGRRLHLFMEQLNLSEFSSVFVSDCSLGGRQTPDTFFRGHSYAGLPYVPE